MAEAGFGEDAVACDPVEGLGVGFLRVWLEHQTLAGAPAASVDQRMEALGKFVPVVMRVAVGTQVEVALRAAQGAEVFAQILGVGVAVDHRRDQEGGVDDFAEAELLGEIIGSAEQGRGGDLAVDQQFHAAEQKALVEGKVDLAGRQIGFEGLDRRVMAARLPAHRDRHTGEAGRVADRRVGRHEYSGRRHRIEIGIEPAVPGRGGDPDGPVAGAADIGAAARFERLVGAGPPPAHVVVPPAGRADVLAELVVEALGHEIALFLGYPLLQPEMRLDDEFGHAFPPVADGPGEEFS